MVKEYSKNKRLVAILEYLLALCFIINCNSIYYQWMPLGYFWIFTIIILLLLIYFERKDNMFSIFLGIIIIISFWVFPLIIDIINGPISTFVSTFLGFVPLLLLYYKIVDDKTSLLLKYSTLISILSLYSFILWLFCSVLEIIPMNESFFNKWGDIGSVPSFNYIYFETQQNVLFGNEIARNSAIFTEAPMYAINLLFALSLEVYIRKKIKVLYIISLLLGVISSTSATAYIVTILILLFQRRIIIRSAFLKIVLFLTLGSVSGLAIINITKDKKENNANSYDQRTGIMEKNFEDFCESPLFGKGFLSESSGNSNSIMCILAEIGVWGALPFIYGLLLKPLLLYRKEECRNVSLAWLMSFLGYCVSVITYCFVPIALIAYMLSYNEKSSNLTE